MIEVIVDACWESSGGASLRVARVVACSSDREATVSFRSVWKICLCLLSRGVGDLLGSRVADFEVG